MIMREDAIFALVGGEISGVVGGETKYHSGQTPPTEEAIVAKLKNLQDAEPMRILRIERNRKLAETDWWCLSDQVPTNEQQLYRKKLRDFPSSASPKLDDKNQLTNITWPSKPEK